MRAVTALVLLCCMGCVTIVWWIMFHVFLGPWSMCYWVHGGATGAGLEALQVPSLVWLSVSFAGCRALVRLEAFVTACPCTGMLCTFAVGFPRAS